MTDPTTFDDALRQAYDKSDQLDAARKQVAQLSAEFSKSVEQMTEGLVSIRVVDSMPSSIGQMLQAAVGLPKPEDRMSRWILARTATDSRVLWNLRFDKNQGYPVEVVEEDDTSHACFEPKALRRVFLELATAGVVGSKIKHLAATAPRRVRELLAALQGSSVMSDKLAKQLRIAPAALAAWVDYLAENDCILVTEAGGRNELTATGVLASFLEPLADRPLSDGPPKALPAADTEPGPQ